MPTGGAPLILLIALEGGGQGQRRPEPVANQHCVQEHDGDPRSFLASMRASACATDLEQHGGRETLATEEIIEVLHRTVGTKLAGPRTSPWRWGSAAGTRASGCRIFRY